MFEMNCRKKSSRKKIAWKTGKKFQNSLIINSKWEYLVGKKWRISNKSLHHHHHEKMNRVQMVIITWNEWKEPLFGSVKSDSELKNFFFHWNSLFVLHVNIIHLFNSIESIDYFRLVIREKENNYHNDEK